MRRRLPGLFGRFGGIVAVDADRLMRVLKSSSAGADSPDRTNQIVQTKENPTPQSRWSAGFIPLRRLPRERGPRERGLRGKGVGQGFLLSSLISPHKTQNALFQACSVSSTGTCQGFLAKLRCGCGVAARPIFAFKMQILETARSETGAVYRRCRCANQLGRNSCKRVAHR